jgi:hypothetical protein
MSQKEFDTWQRRWIEFIKDYEYTIEYHPRKPNIVIYALSRKNKDTLSKPTLWKERQLTELKEMGAELGISSRGGLLAQLIVRPTYREWILRA